MVKKIFCIILMMLLISPVVFGMKQTAKTEIGIADPPKKFDWTADTNNVSKLKGQTVTSGGNTGKVTGIEDTNGDKNLTQCDDIVIKWESKDLRQPYWKYHVKKVDGPTGGKYKYSLDYNSKSKNPPKILGCCHYVNDNNTAGPWIGTLENPFNSIKQALGSGFVKDFDNIYIVGGVYNEANIVIDRVVNLIGSFNFKSHQVLDTPTIDGGYHESTIRIHTSHFPFGVISGLNIRNSGTLEEDAGIKVESENDKTYENNFIIFGNTFENCPNAIYLLDSAYNITIFENIIRKTDFGIFIEEDCYNNLIYNNIFYDNNYFNAKDKGNNNWNNDYPIGGNYWDDYEGTDTDGDGFGDTPHPILGEGNNFDNYPVVDKNTLLNDKPTIQMFDGPTSGKPGTSYNYTVSFIDPEYDDGFLTIDWDDNTPIEILGPFGADNNVTFEHTWTEEGTYNIKVKATDMYGAESDWVTLEVTMPKNNIININLFLQRFFQRFLIFEKILNLII